MNGKLDLIRNAAAKYNRPRAQVWILIKSVFGGSQFDAVAIAKSLEIDPWLDVQDVFLDTGK